MDKLKELEKLEKSLFQISAAISVLSDLKEYLLLKHKWQGIDIDNIPTSLQASYTRFESLAQVLQISDKNIYQVDFALEV